MSILTPMFLGYLEDRGAHWVQHDPQASTVEFALPLDSLAGQHAITDRLELIGYEARQVEFIRYDTLSTVPANPAPLRLLLSILALVLTVQVGAQGDIDRTFLRRYNYGGMQGGLALTTTEDGGFIATGQHEGNGSAGSCDIYVYKVDACGNRIWFRLFGTGESEGGGPLKPRRMADSSSGDTAVMDCC